MVYVFRGILRALHSFDAAPFPLLLSVRVALTHHSVVAFRVDNSIFNNITIGGFDSSGLLHLYSISTASGASIGLPKRLFKTRSSINSSSVPVSLNYSTAHQLQLQDKEFHQSHSLRVFESGAFDSTGSLSSATAPQLLDNSSGFKNS